MKPLAMLSTLALTLSFAVSAMAQSRPAVEAESASVDARTYSCFEDGAGDDAERQVYDCDCGDGLHVGVHCAGFPSIETCCGTKCSELREILASQE